MSSSICSQLRRRALKLRYACGLLSIVALCGIGGAPSLVVLACPTGVPPRPCLTQTLIHHFTSTWDGQTRSLLL